MYRIALLILMVFAFAEANLFSSDNHYPALSDKNIVVKGQVIDSHGIPLTGVSVFLKGTTIGIVTGKDGGFVLDVNDDPSCVLVFSFMGMKTKNILLRDLKNLSKIIMEEDSSVLNGVVFTGMQKIDKNVMTGSVSVVNAKDLKGHGLQSIDKILEGMVPGLNSTTLSGAPGVRAKISIRGENSLNGNTEPLWIVDGLPLLEGVPANSSGNYAGTIMQDGVGNILPEDIESISVLKDASAAAIYGARAANGVIVITTKKGFRSKTQITYDGSYNISTAPKIDLGMMNTEEKLRYEKSLIEHFGPKTAFSVGRNSMLYKLMTGYMNEEEYAAEIERLKKINTNWFKEIFRTASSFRHGINIRGGSEELTYYTTINFTDNKGILESNAFKSAGMLLKMDYRPNDKIIIGIDISSSAKSNKEHASSVDPLVYATFANPYERPYDDKGNYEPDLSYLGNNYTSLTSSGYVFDKFNIIRELKNNIKNQTGVDLSATLNLKYEPVKGLIFNTLLRKSVSYNYSSVAIDAGTYTSWITEQFARIAYPGFLTLPKDYDNGQLSESSGRSSALTGRFQLDYSRSFADSHIISLLGAIDFSSREFNNFGYTSPVYYSDYRITGFPVFNNLNVNYKELYEAAGRLFDTSDGQDRSLSYVINFRYGLKDKYIVNLNGRLDGADVIGNKNQFTPLGSLGLRYNMHKEDFMKKIPCLSELVLKFSYGYTGMIDRSAYPFSVIELSNIVYKGNRIAGSYAFPNPTVKWSKKRDLDLGVDFGLFDNRFSISADYYNNRTNDILTNLNVPNSTGRTSVFANGGIIENSGFEFALNVRWIEKSDWMFSTRFNVSTNKNIIVRSLHNYESVSKMMEDGRPALGGVFDLIGSETGSVYGWKFAGVNKETGNPMYYLSTAGKEEYRKFLENFDSLKDSDKEYYKKALVNLTDVPDYVDFPSGENRPKDRWFQKSMQYLGRTNPKFVGGFSTNLRYKKFDFTTYWTFKTGYIVPTFNDYQNAPKTMSGTNASDLIGAGYSSDLSVSATNRERKYLNYWQQPGDITDVRRFINDGNDLWASIVTDVKYEKGDYLRLNTVSLSYRFDGEFLKKYKLNSLSLSVNANNLFTMTSYKGMDVATGNSFGYPVPKEISVRLSVGF